MDAMSERFVSWKLSKKASEVAHSGQESNKMWGVRGTNTHCAVEWGGSASPADSTCSRP